MIQKLKYIILCLAICSLVFSIHIAIKNYDLRKYLKQPYGPIENDTIIPNNEKVIII